MSDGKIVGVIAILGGCTCLFVLLAAAQEINRLRKFDTFEAFAEAVSKPARDIAAGPLEIRRCYDLSRQHCVPMRFGEWVNALSIAVFYQLLFFIPAAAGTTAMLSGIGYLAIRPDIIAVWVYGDGTPADAGIQMVSRTIPSDPLFRVNLLLGMFSLLYLSTLVMSTQEQREQFFAGCYKSVRELYAARTLYLYLSGGSAAAAPPDHR